MATKYAKWKEEISEHTQDFTGKFNIPEIRDAPLPKCFLANADSSDIVNKNS